MSSSGLANKLLRARQQALQAERIAALEQQRLDRSRQEEEKERRLAELIRKHTEAQRQIQVQVQTRCRSLIALRTTRFRLRKTIRWTLTRTSRAAANITDLPEAWTLPTMRLTVRCH